MKRFRVRKSISLLMAATMVVSSMGTGSTLTTVSAATTETGAVSGKFSFGTSSVSGYTQVSSTTLYSDELGYGFSTTEYPNEAAGWVSGVYYPRTAVFTDANASYVNDAAAYASIGSKVWKETESSGYGVYTYENTSTFDIDLVSADYTVTVELTNPTDSDIKVNLEAEDITKASDVTVAAGENVTQTFTACLVDGRLNLKFLAASSATAEGDAVLQNVYVSQVTVEQQQREAGEKPTVFLASDSTVQTYDSSYYPQTGWGQVLANFFKGADQQIEEKECDDCNYSQAQTYETEYVVVENRAIGGRSSKSFIDEGKLDDLLEDVKPGDYVLVQWGHNDATASRPNRYVSSSDFEKWIQYYVDGVSQRGGTCVLVTPVARRSYTTNADGSVSFKSDFEAYRQIMLKMGEEQGIPVLDLTQASIDVCNKFGEDGSKSLFLWLNAGDYTGYYAGGVSDSTHLQYYGAYKFAQCVAKLIREYDQDTQLDSLKEIVPEIAVPENAPSAVQNVDTTTVGATSVSLTWDVEGDSELYYIYRAELEDGQTAEDVDFTDAEKYSVTAVNKYTDSGCVGGKSYVYAVAGFNEAGVGEKSEMITVTTKSALYKYDFCNAASDPVMDGYLAVTCTQLYTEEAGYGWITAPNNGRYRSDNGNADSNALTDDFCLGDGEFAVDLPNGKYEVTITACDLMSNTSTIKPSYTAEGAAIGGISTKQAAATLTATVVVEDGQLNLTVGGTNKYINGLEITPILIAPSGLIMQEMTFEGDNANFLLQWNDTEEAVSYNVYRKAESDADFSVVKTITAEEKATATTIPFVVVAGEDYQFCVTAVLADGSETPRSNVIVVEAKDPNEIIPEAPANLVCTNSETANMQLSWDATEAAVKYIIYRSDRDEGQKGYKSFEKIAEVYGNTNTSYTDTDSEVTANMTWYYKVQAFSTKGGGDLSESCATEITTELVRSEAETLTDRALVAINLSGDDGTGVDENGKEGTYVSSADSGVYLSWRTFEADPEDVTFTLYKNDEILVKDLTVSNYLDEAGTAEDTYKVVGSSDSVLGLNSASVVTWQDKYIEFTLDTPEDQLMPDGKSTCTYTSNDMSVGDLDGDGKYELIVKWYPSNAKDNSTTGYTGTTIIDAYDIDVNAGTAVKMWRIDLGINIRSGAHYTQFQVWDFDEDGKAEIICKTADGTVDGAGNVIGDATADYRNISGYVLSGPEYITAFDGETGEIIDTTDYTPDRGSVSAWGDAYGNRVDRFLSAVAYLDGESPSAVFCRGYYTRTCLTAYDLVDGDLVERWAFDTNEAGSEYEAQGNHGLSINDIDNDGKDEIIYGALVIDNDGTVKYSTGLGHGDAMHVSDWVSTNDGLEIFSVHEHANAEYQVEIHDAETGEILYGYFTGKDTGRGVAADIDPTSADAEFWSNAAWNGTDGGLYAANSTFDNIIKLSQNTPSVNFSLFWDGDLLSELQDHTFVNSGEKYYPVSTNITKWNYETNSSDLLFESAEILTNNGTKGNLGLVADICGDWREEIVSRTNDESNSKIRIYSTTIETEYSVPCLMENDAYRIGIAWQNVGYNQPANLSYLLSEGLVTATVDVAETSYSQTVVEFYGASDGTYGHDIEGYEVYRLNEETGEYELAGTVDKDDYVRTDLSTGNAVEEAAEAFEAYFDFGGVDGKNSGVGPTQEGYTAITSSTPTYTEEQGYGLTSLDGITFRYYPNTFTDELADLYNDCAMGWNADVDFIVDVPNGDYEVTVYTAHLSGTAKNLIYVEDMTTSVARFANKLAENIVTVNVTVTDGNIEVKTTLDPSYSGAVLLNGLAIKQILPETEETETVTEANIQNVYTFVDKDLEQNTEYTYKVAAVVDGKTSFMSSAATGKTLLNISSVEELDDLTLVQDTPDFESLIPATVTVVDAGGNTVSGVSVEWDLSTMDITTAGEYTIYGTIKGYDGIIELTVIVEENIVIGYDLFADIYTIVGVTPDLPETVNHNMKNGTVETLPVTWNTENLDVSSPGVCELTGTTDLLEKVTVNVIVKDNYITSIDKPSAVEVNVSETPELPSTVTANYADGSTAQVNVTWDELDTSVVGTYEVNGVVEEYSGTVTITVYVQKPAYMKFDFGIKASKVADGWTGITVNPKGGSAFGDYVYTAEQGYGFTDIDSDTLTTAIQGRTEEFTYTGDGVLPYDVYTDFALPSNVEFKADLPNGVYTVQVLANSIYSSSVKVSIEGGSNVTISNAAGSYTLYTQEGVEITDGQLNLTFPSGTYRMGAVIITAESFAEEDPEEDPTEDPTEESSEDPTEESSDDPTEESSEDPTEESSEDPTEESSEDPTEESSEEITEDSSTEDSTEESTEAPTEEEPESGSIFDKIVSIISDIVKTIIGIIKGFRRP